MNQTETTTPSTSAQPQTIHLFKAILCGQDNLLSQAIDAFLKQTHWDVVRVPGNVDPDGLIEKTRNLGPDVVIFCQEKTEDDSSLVMSLVNEHICAKVVTIAMDSNRMDVYCEQTFFLQGASDLISVINPEFSLKRKIEKEVGPIDQITINPEQKF